MSHRWPRPPAIHGAVQAPGNGLHVDESHASVARLGNRLPRKARTDATIGMGGVNDNRLEFRLLVIHEETSEPDELTVEHGYRHLRQSRRHQGGLPSGNGT